MKKYGYIFLILFWSLLLTVPGVPAFSKTINFAVASDVHYSADGTNKTPVILNGFVERVNENNYDFVIFLGDNIEKSKERNLVGFLRSLKKMETPYYLVLGNRDAHKISGIEKKVYLNTVAKYNKKQKKAEASYSFYPTSDVIFIVVDNVSSGMPSSHGVFSQSTLKWMDEVLDKNKNKKAVIFQHVPYMTPYENSGYEILEKNDFRALIARHDNILAVFGGHYHKEATIKDSKGIIHVCAPALSEEPYYYLDMSLSYNKKLFKKAKNFQLDGALKPSI